MRNFSRAVTLVLIGVACFVQIDSAQAYSPLTFRYEHHLYSLDPDFFPAWRTPVEVWKFNGKAIVPPAELRVDGDNIPPLPEGVTKVEEALWNTAAIRATLQERIGSAINRSAGDVHIRKTATGGVVFDGIGMQGRELDLDKAAELTREALEQNITDVILPVVLLQPQVTVESEELRDMGIVEVVTVGESDYAGSPSARKYNIAVGLSKFNGHIIPQGETFSFNQVLGPVDASTGYKKELVILGDRTLPDYGGGLCQVSTTAYRGIWEYGFPIADRRNHSYSVRYYGPQGTDATIYPPHTDMKFVNDSPGALLMQTHTEDDKAYFIYYGTRDNRSSQIVGPFIWGQTNPPADRTEETLDIPAGTTRKVGTAVPGMRAAWYRIVSAAPAAPNTVVEPYYSIYEARPNFTQIGVESLTPKVEEATEPEPVQAE